MLYAFDILNDKAIAWLYGTGRVWMEILQFSVNVLIMIFNLQ